MGKTEKLPLGTIPHRQYGTKDPDAQILEIPYEHEQLSMLVIHPNKSDGLPKVKQSVT